MSSSIIVRQEKGILRITLAKPDTKNTLTANLLKELDEIFSQAESVADIYLVVIEGSEGYFCTGMDFNEVDTDNIQIFTSAYFDLLKRMTSYPKVIVSLVDGQVIAGGVGLVAASDLVFATPTSHFSLSEALWGLIPACVIPFLIRRVGFQKAYTLTLTTIPIPTEEATKIQLVDGVYENLNKPLVSLMARVRLIKPETIKAIKSYFKEIWIIDEATKQVAVNTLSKVVEQPFVKQQLVDFATKGVYPWTR